MGYPLELIEPNQDGHAAEFTCAVCCSLVDAPLLTTCSHVFCMSCLQDWMNHKPSCPTCSQELDPRHGAGELKLASPIAWRVLGRLRVRCSLPGCKWVGEYSEVGAHLTSSESHQTVGEPMDVSTGEGGSSSAAQPPQQQARQPQHAQPTPQQQQQQQQKTGRDQAEALKAAGNSKFEQRIYPDAIVLYTKAINLAPEVPTYYCNRAAAYFNSGRFSDCITDCQLAIQRDPALGKAYKRLARAHSELGEYDKARSACADGFAKSGESALKADLDLATQLLAWQREGEAAMGNGDHSLARTFFANMLAKTNAPQTRLWLVKAELGLGLCDRALRTTREVIKAHPNISEAYVLRGIALLFSADLDQAQKHLREALRLDPDAAEAGRAMKKARKLERHMDAARQASTRREFEVASSEYTEALNLIDAPPHAPLSASLYAERAAARLRLKDYEACLKDCAIAIYAMDDCKSAWLTKAQALHALNRHEEALNDMHTISQTFQNDPQVSHALQRASFEVRKAKRPDYYALLNIPSIASSVEIKQAYKQRALEWHPDKHQESESARKAAEDHFKLLGEALEILADDFTRRLYNEGYDKEAIAERVAAANRAAHNHEKDGCCNRGGGCGGCG